MVFVSITVIAVVTSTGCKKDLVIEATEQEIVKIERNSCFAYYVDVNHKLCFVNRPCSSHRIINVYCPDSLMTDAQIIYFNRIKKEKQKRKK
jgi:hypothetical protein